MARNLARSSCGVFASSARASTRALKSSQESSRLRKRSSGSSGALSASKTSSVAVDSAASAMSVMRYSIGVAGSGSGWGWLGLSSPLRGRKRPFGPRRRASGIRGEVCIAPSLPFPGKRETNEALINSTDSGDSHTMDPARDLGLYLHPLAEAEQPQPRSLERVSAEDQCSAVVEEEGAGPRVRVESGDRALHALHATRDHAAGTQ